VIAQDEATHTVTAVRETLDRSNLGLLKVGDPINLERAMAADGRFDGHMVQGHVDQTIECLEKTGEAGSWRFQFAFTTSNTEYLVEKGSVCLNGVSLTVASCSNSEFSVVIIPYTIEHTNFQNISTGDTLNLEFDIVGKYIAARLAAQQ
jgi:riboflavin synthase